MLKVTFFILNKIYFDIDLPTVYITFIFICTSFYKEKYKNKNAHTVDCYQRNF